MTIKKKGDSNWEYCVYLGQDKDGKKKYKRKCGFKTRKACIEEASKFENEKTINKDNIKTFKEVGLMYLEDCRNRGLRQTTINSYTNAFKIICDNFKKTNTDIHQIKSNDILELINTKNIRKNNPKNYLNRYIKCIFSFALKNKIINKNIFENISINPKTNSNRCIWNQTELKKYIALLKDFKYFDIVYLALETGLRRGELLALTWDCIDFERNTLYVKTSYVISGKFIGFSDPKTKSGFREIALLKQSIDLLKKRYKNRTSKYIFPNPRNNSIPIHPTTLTLCF